MVEIVADGASAGYLRGYSDPEYIESLNSLKLPFLPIGKHRAFPIKGDSMLPIKSGSFIIARLPSLGCNSNITPFLNLII